MAKELAQADVANEVCAVMQRVKIKNQGDLFRIRTLGFRGEALPSIASISHLTIVTAADGEVYGTKLVAKGGEIESQDPISTQWEQRLQLKTCFITPQLAQVYEEFTRLSWLILSMLSTV